MGELASKFRWGDVKDLNWGNLDGRIEMEDHCKHKYLLSIEGAFACESLRRPRATAAQLAQALTMPALQLQTLDV